MEEKVVLLTAAGSGIGAACARLLAERGSRIAILSSSGKGEALGGELGGVGVTGSNLEPSDLESFVAETISRFGRIDGVVNSAGHGPKGELLEISDDAWHRAMEVYLLNVIRVCRLVTPALEKAGGGSIVNISSFSAVEPDLEFPTSSVFRAGLSAFTKLYANAFSGQKIRINNILPGFVDSLPEQERFRRRIPLSRYGTVGEIAETTAFLLSDGAAFITGQSILVDGGLTQSI